MAEKQSYDFLLFFTRRRGAGAAAAGVLDRKVQRCGTLLFLPRAPVPFTRRARTAAAQRVRTARSKGATPLLSSEFGFALALIKNSTVAYCDSGSHASDPGIPSTA